MILFISGAPATGKTRLARWLGQALSLPVISKDAIKESLFEELGSENREASRQLGELAFAEFTRQVRELAAARDSFICESAFRSGDQAFYRGVTSQAEQRVANAHCVASNETILTRFRQRACAGGRHPGHHDAHNIDELSALLSARTYVPLADVPSIVPTDDFGGDRFLQARERILKILRAALD